jgi:hypothetical protein
VYVCVYVYVLHIHICKQDFKSCGLTGHSETPFTINLKLLKHYYYGIYVCCQNVNRIKWEGAIIYAF